MISVPCPARCNYAYCSLAAQQEPRCADSDSPRECYRISPCSCRVANPGTTETWDRAGVWGFGTSGAREAQSVPGRRGEQMLPAVMPCSYQRSCVRSMMALVAGSPAALSCRVASRPRAAPGATFQRAPAMGVESRTGAPTLGSGGNVRRFRFGPQSGSHSHVSSSRSSNRTGGFPASGSRTRSCLRPWKASRSRSKVSEVVLVP